jgi:hypothetical protein
MRNIFSKLKAWLYNDLLRTDFWTEEFFAQLEKEKYMVVKSTNTSTISTTVVPAVVFTGGDYKPTRLASGLIGFRAPFDVRVEAGKSQVVDLKTKCSVYLLFPRGTVDNVVDPQTNIVISLTATDLPLVILAGEIIARAIPLLTPEYEVK